MTPWMMLDIGISMLLISYAADMMSLFISSLSHTTTAAMTIMPFVLIFQLVFFGGIIPLPAWSQRLSDYTISNYGIRAIAAQSGYNELPMVTAWNTLAGMKNQEIGGTLTLGQLLDLLKSPAVEKHRDTEVLRSYTVGEAAEFLDFLNIDTIPEEERNQKLNDPVTLGQIVDFLESSESLQAKRDQSITMKTTVGGLLDLFGEENVKHLVQQKTAAASYKPEYERTQKNIVQNWLMLGMFALLFAFLSTLVLELIDKDKR